MNELTSDVCDTLIHVYKKFIDFSIPVLGCLLIRVTGTVKCCCFFKACCLQLLRHGQYQLPTGNLYNNCQVHPLGLHFLINELDSHKIH